VQLLVWLFDPHRLVLLWGEVFRVSLRITHDHAVSRRLRCAHNGGSSGFRPVGLSDGHAPHSLEGRWPSCPRNTSRGQQKREGLTRPDRVRVRNTGPPPLCCGPCRDRRLAVFQARACG
jgi:hypothetical protein